MTGRADEAVRRDHRPARRAVSAVPAHRPKASSRPPAPSVDARAAQSADSRSLWLMGSLAAIGGAFVVFVFATITGAGDTPLLPASPLTIPIEAMPSAVKARHLATFASLDGVDDKRQEPTAVAPRSTGAPFVGSLVIDSMPVSARAFVNGKLVGMTPLVLTEVPVGSRAIRLEADDHATWSSTVRVIADHRTHVNVTLVRSR